MSEGEIILTVLVLTLSLLVNFYRTSLKAWAAYGNRMEEGLSYYMKHNKLPEDFDRSLKDD